MTAPHLSPRVDEASRKLVREIADAFKAKRTARGDRQRDVAQYLRALNIYGLTLAVVPINHMRNRT